MRFFYNIVAAGATACFAAALPIIETDRNLLGTRFTSPAPPNYHHFTTRGYEDDPLPRGWWKIVLITIAIQIAFGLVMYLFWACCAVCCGSCMYCNAKSADRKNRAGDGREGIQLEPRF